MENGEISARRISASSQWDGGHAAEQGRLHFQKSGAKQGAWSTGKNDLEQWLQIDLGSQFTRVTGVATQGRNDRYSQWVRRYKLLYSNNGENFQYYKEQGQSTVKVKKRLSSLLYTVSLHPGVVMDTVDILLGWHPGHGLAIYCQ